MGLGVKEGTWAPSAMHARCWARNAPPPAAPHPAPNLPARTPPAVHPELSSPLREGQASHHALYADLSSLHTVLRAASHPATWAEPAAAAGGPADGEALAAVEAGAGAAGSSGSLWDALAGSAGLCMRPQLVLMLSALLPVEARLAYLGLRHAAYAGPGAGQRWWRSACRWLAS